MRRGVTAYTLDKRLSKLERSLGMRETPAMTYSRELLTLWLATSEHGAELLMDREDASHAPGGIVVMLRAKAGRDLINAIVTDFYENVDL